MHKKPNWAYDPVDDPSWSYLTKALGTDGDPVGFRDEWRKLTDADRLELNQAARKEFAAQQKGSGVTRIFDSERF